MLTYYYLYLKNWLENQEEGQDLAEYALLLVLIAILIVAALTLFRGALEDVFARITAVLGSQ